MTQAKKRNLRLMPQPASVTRARRFVGTVLQDWGLSYLVEDAQLATSEIVANAVRHAGTDMLLAVTSGPSIVVSLRDGRPDLHRPPVMDLNELAESGRGLQIVAAVAFDWGVAATRDGKTVWFSLRPSRDWAQREIRAPGELSRVSR